jgi:RimJ/RimL family protein N-acetyltransferase
MGADINRLRGHRPDEPRSLALLGMTSVPCLTVESVEWWAMNVAQAKIILETARLILREFVPGDVDALAAVICDPETMKHYPAPFDRTAVWIGLIATVDATRRMGSGCGLWF